MDLVTTLQERGMVHDCMPGTAEQLSKEPTTVYLGIDPTADSLHIGHLASIMLLKHFQNAGHKPILLVGGATGMIGDPSGKNAERNLLDIETIRHNQNSIKEQLKNYLDFSDLPNKAEIVNNYDWMHPLRFLDFIRDVGKHITISYMMAKDSVKKRIETGLSFTEFTYQLVQGYDFYHLWKTKNCKLQIGGADQWGNITTGTELIRRKAGGEAFALTCPLITKSDGSKFGKTEEGNVWLNPEYTSPYKFYQFWLNVSDEDAKRYLYVFTTLSNEEIKVLHESHQKEPHTRLMQKELSKQVTIMAHSEADYQMAIEASNILFGKSAVESLKKIDEKTFLQVFEGVPLFDIPKQSLEKGVNIIDLTTDLTSVFSSKGEIRRLIKENGLSLNKEKITDPAYEVTPKDLIANKYLLIQKGKKVFFLIQIK
jgi:tyrosyl-tRNA synthetase